MRRTHWLHVGLIAMSANLVATAEAHGQIATPISTAFNVTLKTFTPIDSTFINPTFTTFPIALVHTVSGTPSDYRVSRFADFRDANWLPYVTRPSVNVPISWFPVTTSGSRQIMLYLQLRMKNPKAGQIISSINGVTTVQPDFLFSDALGRRLRIIYAG